MKAPADTRRRAPTARIGFPAVPPGSPSSLLLYSPPTRYAARAVGGVRGKTSRDTGRWHVHVLANGNRAPGCAGTNECREGLVEIWARQG